MMDLQCSLFLFHFLCDFLNIVRMGIPITCDVYMSWHLGDPFYNKTTEQHT